MTPKSSKPSRTVACVPAPAVPLALPLPSALIVIVVVVAYAALAALGLPQAVVLAGLAGAGTLGVRLATGLSRGSAKRRRV